MLSGNRERIKCSNFFLFNCCVLLIYKIYLIIYISSRMNFQPTNKWKCFKCDKNSCYSIIYFIIDLYTHIGTEFFESFLSILLLNNVIRYEKSWLVNRWIRREYRNKMDGIHVWIAFDKMFIEMRKEWIFFVRLNWKKLYQSISIHVAKHYGSAWKLSVAFWLITKQIIIYTSVSVNICYLRVRKQQEQAYMENYVRCGDGDYVSRGRREDLNELVKRDLWSTVKLVIISSW